MYIWANPPPPCNTLLCYLSGLLISLWTALWTENSLHSLWQFWSSPKLGRHVIGDVWFVTCDWWLVICDLWLVTSDLLLVIGDLWFVTCDWWLVICDMWFGTSNLWLLPGYNGVGSIPWGYSGLMMMMILLHLLLPHLLLLLQ